MTVLSQLVRQRLQIQSSNGTEAFWSLCELQVHSRPTSTPPAVLRSIFDAVNSIEKTYEPYAVHLSHISRDASAEAAADQAAHDLLVSLYPTFVAALDSELQQDLEQIRDGRRKGASGSKSSAASGW